MSLRIVGAGLPRTGTHSLKNALEHLLGGRCYHMSEIPGHPFDLGEGWNRALAGDTTDLDQLFDGYIAAVDWPSSMLWRELSEANPNALVLLSVRDTAETWWHSVNETILPVARMALAPDWNQGRGLINLLERFTGTKHWDNPETMMAACERHNAEVRKIVPHHRLLEWHATEGWEPICRALVCACPMSRSHGSTRGANGADGKKVSETCHSEPTLAPARSAGEAKNLSFCIKGVYASMNLSLFAEFILTGEAVSKGSE